MRALKVVLENKSQRKFLLDNAKFIPVKAPQVFEKVFIVKDMTQEQRKERKSKYQSDRI